MRDELVRAITADGLVKAVAVTGRDLVERAREIHTLLPMATAALGRTLLAASMMGDMLKIDGGLPHTPDQGRRAAGDGTGRVGQQRQRAGAMCRIPMWSCERRHPESWMWAGPLARQGTSPSSRTWG